MYVRDQGQQAKSCYTFLHDFFSLKILIIDDEVFLPLELKDVPGWNFFHETGPKLVSCGANMQLLVKFLKKIRVW